jgi:hypothetical protein
MDDTFEIYPDEIAELKTVREFEIWLNALDSVIAFTNIDRLIEHLTTIDKPEFVMYALEFKHKYL